MNDDASREHPYGVSKGAAAARDVASPRRSTGLLIVATIEAFGGVVAGGLAPMAISSFEELFKGFGADLPPLTRFVIASANGWWIFTLAGIAIVAWVARAPMASHVERNRQLLAVAAFAIALGVACSLSLYALYLPIFKLGAVV